MQFMLYICQPVCVYTSFIWNNFVSHILRYDLCCLSFAIFVFLVLNHFIFVVILCFYLL